jgi:hypothetical protein
MCQDFAPKFLQKNCVLLHDNAPSHTSFYTRTFFNQKQHNCRPLPALLFSASPIQDKFERPQFWHNWGDRGRIAGGVEQPHRTRLLGCIQNGRSAGKDAYTRKGAISRAKSYFLTRWKHQSQTLWTALHRTLPEYIPDRYLHVNLLDDINIIWPYLFLSARIFYRYLNCFYDSIKSRDSPAGIAKGYGLNCMGSIIGKGKIWLFSIASIPVLGPNQCPIELMMGAIFLQIKRRGR